MKQMLARLLSALLCLSLLAACGDRSDPPAEEGNAAGTELREVDVVLDWYPNALHAFLYVAIEKGYYAAEGLKVNIRFPSNANDAISMVAAGKADIGLYYQQDVIQARANQSVPVKSIAAVVQKPLNIILSLKEENITSPRDLVGKTVGYAGTELSEALTRSIMANVGADYSDVTMIDVGFDLMSSMTTGNVDATIGCLVNHEVPQMEEEGFEVNWFAVDDYGVPTYYEGIFLANGDAIENDSGMLKAFLRASAKGFADMQADPEEALRVLLDNQNEENFPLSETVERSSMETLLPLMETADAKFLSQSDACWQENIDWMLAQGLIGSAPALDDVRVNLDF
ncbi:ABC transporter substrate-binding protein [uncultured Dysosmobacter sp.]|uniref:ABC transporter substrate-binding protein n=1 Tax=uncultured Dysosmobacter sp. TaxID=2591384 RepID=UPI00261F5BD8|nr:ABC transporter substrate-binding protein [uncultured Dysosmobacter sp.]